RTSPSVMMSMPAVSMSRMAVCTASSNISSMSPGPISAPSHAFTAVNHQPGLPWDPTTEVGSRGSVAMGVIIRPARRYAPDRAGPANLEGGRPPAGACPRRQLDVLGHREVAEHGALLRRVADPARGDGVRRQAADRLPGEGDGAAGGAQVAHHRAQRRRLAGAVAADEADE